MSEVDWSQYKSFDDIPAELIKDFTRKVNETGDKIEKLIEEASKDFSASPSAEWVYRMRIVNNVFIRYYQPQMVAVLSPPREQ